MSAPAMRLGGHALVEALIAQGVDTVFGVAGESFLAALDGMLEHAGRIRFVACRQEGGAAFMAEAAGKLSGRPGVCFVTRGPGAANAAIGVHTAFQDSTPMVLLVGQVGSDHRDREAFQEIDFRQMFGPGTLGMAKWVGECHAADRLPEYVARAFRTAMQGRPGPVVLALPEDVLSAETAAPVLARVEPARAWPEPAALDAALAILARAERPLVIAGGPGWSAAACADLERFAEAWALPVACGFRFQDTFDNEHPNHAGDVGIGVSPALAERVRRADVIVAFGVRLGEMTTGGYSLVEAPRPKQTLIHVHPGAEELGRVHEPDVAILASVAGAASAFAARPAPHASDPAHAARRAEVARAHADWLANRRPTPVEPLDLAEVMTTLQRRLPPDAVYANGAGNFSGWLHRFVAYRSIARAGGRTQLAPTVGAMGYGLPAAIAASVLQPGRTVVAVCGDGDFLMTGQELATAAAEGAGRGTGRLVALVVDNGIWGTIRMHQERRFPGRVSGSTLAAQPDFAALARAFGWRAARVERTAEFEPALAEALAPGAPTLIHLRLDPEVSTSRATISSIRRAASGA